MTSVLPNPLANFQLPFFQTLFSLPNSLATTSLFFAAFFFLFFFLYFYTVRSQELAIIFFSKCPHYLDQFQTIALLAYRLTDSKFLFPPLIFFFTFI